MRKRAIAGFLGLLLVQSSAFASVKDFGFYAVYDRLRGQDYLSEVAGKSNLTPWNFDSGALATDFPQRVQQTPKMKLLLTLPLTASTDYTSGINAAVFTNANGARTTYLNHVKAGLEGSFRH